MVVARVELPDGRIGRFEVPEGTTPEQVLSFARQQGVSAPAPAQPSIQQPQESLGRTVLEQGLQGATFGFGEEISSRLGAGIASVLTDEDFDVLLEEAQKLSRERLTRQTEQRPGASFASQLAGGLVTGGAAATTRGGAALARSLGTGGLRARAAKTAATGATSGALFGAGTAKEGERLEGATTGAALGAAGGAALPVAGAALRGAAGAFRKSPIPNADQVRQQASQLFQEAERKGGTLTPTFTNRFVDKIQEFKPQTEVGKLVGGDSPVSKIIDRIATIRNKPITLDAAQELDEFLGDAIDSFTDLGRLTKEGKKILDVQTAFRESIENASEASIVGGKEGFTALKEARKLWSTSRKLADIERIVTRAELTDNPATAIKSGFRTLLNNPKRLKSFSKSERKAIKKAAQTGVITDTLRLFGSRLIPIVTFGATGGLGATAATAAAATASRGLAAKAQVRRANELAKLVAGGTRQPPMALPRDRGLAAALLGGQVGGEQ